MGRSRTPLRRLRTNSASSWVRNRRSSWSKTPSARRRKKRGAPYSETLPRGERMAAPGASVSPSWYEIFFVPARAVQQEERRAGLIFARHDSGGRSRGRRSCALSYRDAQRWEDLFEPVAAGLEPGRQLEVFAEVFGVLVYREAWGISGDLEQHPARLAEVDRTEVVAVKHGRNAVAERRNLLAHRELGLLVGDPERDVVHGAYAHASAGEAGRVHHVDQGCLARPRPLRA